MQRDDVGAVDEASLSFPLEFERDELHAASFNCAPKSRDSRSQRRFRAMAAGWLPLASSWSGPITVTLATASPFHCSTGEDTAARPGITLESTKARRCFRARS